MLKNLVFGVLLVCTTVAAEEDYEYDFWYSADSYGYDIRSRVRGGNSRLYQDYLRSLCNRDSLCLGYNTNGWLKYLIAKPSKMTKLPHLEWAQKAPGSLPHGLFVKQESDPSIKECNDAGFCRWTPSPKTPPTPAPPTGPCAVVGERCLNNDVGFPHVPYKHCCGKATCMEKDKSPGGYGRLCWAPLQERYDFFDKLDSPLKDIRQVQGGSLESIASACDWDRECMGFNTNGWLKKAVLDPSKLVRIPVDWWNDSNGGTYTKKVADPSSRSCDSDIYCTWSTWVPPNPDDFSSAGNGGY